MRTIAATLLVLSMMTMAPLVASTHDSGDCVPGQADAIALGDYYIDDRGDPEGTGLVTGGGTWIYMESNGLDGLQRGGGFSYPAPLDMVISGEDPLTTENCGHGPDTIIF